MTKHDTILTVRTEHLTGEMLLIDIGHTMIISDHPEFMGGQGKGPNPGELIKGAVASSAAIHLGRMFEREGLSVQSFSVACSTGFETVRREEGPLPSSTTLSNFQVHVAVVGDLDDAAIGKIESAVHDCPVAKALAAGIGIEECNVFTPNAATRAARASSHLVEQMHARRPDAGQKLVQPVNTLTGVRADYLGGGRALLKWSNTAYQVEVEREDGQKTNGAPPEKLLLAGLCACTSVFVARAAAVAGADAEVRVVASGSFDAASGDFSIVKTLEVTGILDEDQKRTMAFFGENCAIGETLRRKAEINVAVERIAPSDPTMAGLSLSAMDADAVSIARRFDAVVCDDGTCCVPDVSAVAASRSK